MGKRFSNIRGLNAPILTLLVLIAPLVFYFLAYVPARKMYYTKRDFRVLRDMSDQLKSKIENLSTVLHGAAGNVHPNQDQDDKHSHQDPAAEKIMNLVNIAQDIQIISKPQIKASPAHDELLLVHDHSLIFKKNDAFQIKPHLRLEGESFWLHFEYNGKFMPESDSPYDVTIHAKSKLNDIIKPIVGRDIFDDILLTQLDGSVIFQKNRTELKASRLDSFQGKDGKTVHFAENNRLSNLLDVHIGGTDYKIFTQPIRLFFTSSHGHINEDKPNDGHAGHLPIGLSPGKEDNTPKNKKKDTQFGGSQYVEWVLAGLVRTDRFNSESQAISSGIVIGFMFLVLLLGLSWPLIKLWYIGPKDRLTTFDIVFVSASAVLGTAILTFILLDFYSENRLGKDLDLQLKELAGDISTNFDSELVRAYRQLDNLNSKYKASELETNDINKENKKSLFVTYPDIVDYRDPHKTPYPYFELVAWINNDGRQEAKWIVKDQASPLIDVSSRDYFKSVNEKRAWTVVSNANTETLKDIWLQPIYSLTTGKNEAVLSKPLENETLHSNAHEKETQHPSKSQKPKTAHSTHSENEAESSKPDGGAIVSALSFRPLSLIGPVLPDGFGFAVIDKEGEVLFHSDDRRNLRENFFRECDNNSILRSIVLGSANDFVDVQYTGKGYRLYVRPMLDNLPWYLVAFGDKEILRTTNMEIVTVSMILFLCYAGILLLLLGLGFFVLKERGRNWFWPNEVHAGHYRHLTVFYLLLSALFFVGVFTSESVEILFMSFLLPVVGVALTYLKMKRGYILMTWKRALLYFLVSLTLIILLLTWRRMFEPELKTFILSVGLVLTGLFFFSARFSRFFDRKKTPSFQTGYVLAAVAFLTLISILPTIGYFKIAYDLELELFIKNRQVKFAQSLEERASRVQAKYINGQFPDLKPFVDKRLKETLDIYVPKEIQMGATDTTSNLNDSWGKELKQQLVKIRPLYNQNSVETRQLIHDESANELWKWEKGDSSATLSFVKLRYRGNEELELSSVLPVFSFPRTPFWWIGLFAILAVLFALIRFITRRLFLLDLHAAYTLFTRELSSSSLSHNVLVLGPPSSGKSDFLKRKDFYLIDLVKIAKTGRWAETFNYDSIPDNKVIAIDHFEYKMESQDWNREKLLLLENLKYAHKKKVVVASTLDPTNYQYYHGNGNHSSNGTSHEETAIKINDRWAEVWSSYLRIYIEDEGDSKAFSDIVTKF